jgi:hypothetical protein
MGRVMRRVLAFAVCGLSLGACTSTDIFKMDTTPTPAMLQVESDPPGADAKLSTGGASCKTPCSLPVTATTGEFTVIYSLPGYETEAVQVAVSAPGGSLEAPHLDPNPARIEMEKAQPAVTKRRAPRKPAAKKPAATAKPAGAATTTTTTTVKPAARKPAARRPAPAPAPAAAAPAPASAPAASAPASPWPATPPASTQPAPAQQ